MKATTPEVLGIEGAVLEVSPVSEMDQAAVLALVLPPASLVSVLTTQPPKKQRLLKWWPAC